MSIQESGEMYLESIFRLSQSNPYVRAIDVGEYMGYSKPSVSRAMKLLRDGGFLTVDEDGELSDTFFDKFCTAVAAITAEIPAERQKILDVYGE